jgi:hypothetical protein
LGLRLQIGVGGWFGFYSIDWDFLVPQYQEERPMPAADVEREYCSPVRKLMRFFRRSRDGWKRKCLGVKQAHKLLKNKVRALEHSRARWKQQVAEQQVRIAELEAELQKTAAC